MESKLSHAESFAKDARMQSRNPDSKKQNSEELSEIQRFFPQMLSSSSHSTTSRSTTALSRRDFIRKSVLAA
ncbi:MAG: hypothetical protein LBC18_15645, partial [Opitutaceae bacterium]|nr:hypothetical protein [Opitutaceae bacterium]